MRSLLRMFPQLHRTFAVDAHQRVTCVDIVGAGEQDVPTCISIADRECRMGPVVTWTVLPPGMVPQCGRIHRHHLITPLIFHWTLAMVSTRDIGNTFKTA
eukprot:scpid94260/ scgid29253/ 